MDKSDLEKYLEEVKTGRDLVRLGVVPKTSAQHLALITRRRLEGLKEGIEAKIADEALGEWLPLFPETSVPFPTGQITDAAEIENYAKNGMKVIGRGGNLVGVNGTITEIRVVRGGTSVYRHFYGIQWDSDVGGNALNGYGTFSNPSEFALLVPERKVVTGHSINSMAVADPNRGYKVRFETEYSGVVYTDYEQSRAVIPAGAIGMLTGYDDQRKTVSVKLAEPAPGQGNRLNYAFREQDICDLIQVSSIGQMEPVEREQAVRNRVLLDFFPTTVLEPVRAERLLIALLMCYDTRAHHFALYGPPGGGKTQAVRDIASIAMQQEVSFVVESCKVQCSPFSLFDSEYANKCPPCPECMARYDKDFKGTGRFRLQKPEDVKVTVVKYGPGHGIEFVEGNTKLSRTHLAGYKIPMFDRTEAQGMGDDYDPERFQPGILSRTNNGLLLLDQLEMLLEPTYAGMLETLNAGTIQPEQQRYPWPAHCLLIGTANKHSDLPDYVNDRIALLAVRYPEGPKAVDESYEITLRSFHGKRIELEEVHLGDTHREAVEPLERILAPVMVERAVDAFYIKFRSEYQGEGKLDILGSNRSKLDALAAARAKFLVDQILSEGSGSIVTEAQMLLGIAYALCTRVQGKVPDADKKTKELLVEWAGENFPGLVQQENNTFWCSVYRHIAVRETQIPEVTPNFVVEITSYTSDASSAVDTFAEVKRAYDQPGNNAAQLAKIEHPFMDYLFREQPEFAYAKPHEVKELVAFMVQMRRTASKDCEPPGILAER